MKSGTSFFNATLFRKNLTRYWPIWAIYAVIWIYALPVQCFMAVARNQLWMGDTPLAQVQAFANNILDLLPYLGLFTAFTFGVLTAMGVFSYLYNSRAAGLLHALPMRREGLFLTGYLSGLVCLLGPNLLVWLLTLGAEGLCSGYMDLYTASLWLAGQSAMCLFFYSFAVFCAMFTGHLLALPAFYGILNFLVITVTFLFNTLLEPFLFGFAGLPQQMERAVFWLTPVVRLGDRLNWYNTGFGYRLQGGTELAVYAAAGVLLAAAALLVYRRRHIESAGDVVAVAVMRPIFKYGVALCSGLCLGFWLYAVFGLDTPGNLIGSLLLWTFIGYFAAEMLLKKTFRVWKAWRGCACLMVLLAVGLLLLRMDGFGFVSRVPAPAAVRSVTVDGMGSYPYDAGRSFEFTTEDSALIEKTVALHRAIVDQHKHPDPGEGGETEYIRLHVTYVLSNGTTLRRNYGAHIREGGKLEGAARDFYCDGQVAQLAYGLDEIDPAHLHNIEVSSLWNPRGPKNEYFDLQRDIPAQQRQATMLAIYEAVLADFAQGNLGRRYLFDEEDARQLNTCTADLYIYWHAPYEDDPALPPWRAATSSYLTYHSCGITLTPHAEHTIRVLTELGLLDEDTTLRLYREIVDEENRAKLIYGAADHDPLTLNPNSAGFSVIGGADGPTAVLVSE